MGTLIKDEAKYEQIEETYKLSQYLIGQGYEITNDLGVRANKEWMESTCRFNIQNPKETVKHRFFLSFPTTVSWSIGRISIKPEIIEVEVSKEYFGNLKKIMKPFSKKQKKDITLKVNSEYPQKNVLNRKGECLNGPKITLPF